MTRRIWIALLAVALVVVSTPVPVFAAEDAGRAQTDAGQISASAETSLMASASAELRRIEDVRKTRHVNMTLDWPFSETQAQPGTTTTRPFFKTTAGLVTLGVIAAAVVTVVVIARHNSSGSSPGY